MKEFYKIVLNSIVVLQNEIDHGGLSYEKLEQLDELLDLRDKLAETLNQGALC